MSRNAGFAQFIAGHRAAEARALALIREEGPRAPADAFSRAMELCDLVPDDATDPLRERDVANTRATWAKIRAWAASHAPS